MSYFISDLPIEEVGDMLGVRAYNILKRMGLDTCGHLLTLAVEDLNSNKWGMQLGLPAFKRVCETVEYLRSCV